MAFAADLHFELGDSPLQAKKLLLEGSLLSFQSSDLLLNTTVLSFLEIKMPLPNSHKELHFLFYSDELVG